MIFPFFVDVHYKCHPQPQTTQPPEHDPEMVDWDEQQEPTIAGLGVGGQLSGSTRHHVRNTPTNLPSLPSPITRIWPKKEWREKL